MGILQTSVLEGIKQQKRSLEELQTGLSSAIASNEQCEGVALKLKVKGSQ